MPLECETCGAKDKVFVVKHYCKNILESRDILCEIHFMAKALAAHQLCKMIHPDMAKIIEKEGDDLFQENLKFNSELKNFLKSNASFDKPKEEE